MSVVCDLGTGYLKLGWNTSTYPDHIIPNMLGYPNRKYQEFFDINDPNGKREFYDEELNEQLWRLELHKPMEHGIVQDWDALTKVLAYGLISKVNFKQMQLNPSDHSIFLTEPALNPKENREKLVETVLEDFQFSACKVETQATLTLVSQAKSTGMVLDSGDGVTHIVPICDGYILEKSIRRINIAGHDISRYLANLLFKRGYRFFSSYDIDQVRKIKEGCCYLALDPLKEAHLFTDTTALNQDYKLPDGNWVTVRAERYQAAEVLFYPGLLGKEEFNIADIVVDSFAETPEDYKVELASNVLLSGGTTMLPGFAQRLKSMVQEKMKERSMGFKIKINDPLNRKILVFLGAAIVSLIIESDPDQWISREEWLEEGSRCVYKFDS